MRTFSSASSAGYALGRDRFGGVLIYLDVFLLTCMWAVWELGFDFWPLVLRLVAPVFIAAVVLPIMPPICPSHGRPTDTRPFEIGLTNAHRVRRSPRLTAPRAKSAGSSTQRPKRIRRSGDAAGRLAISILATVTHAVSASSRPRWIPGSSRSGPQTASPAKASATRAPSTSPLAWVRRCRATDRAGHSRLPCPDHRPLRRRRQDRAWRLGGRQRQCR